MVLIAYLTLCMLGIFMLLLSCLYFFKINFLKIFQEHFQSVKLFGSRSGPLSGSKLFAKVSSTRQKSPLARKELNMHMQWATRLVFGHMCRYQFSGATLCYVGLCYATVCATLRCYITNIEQSRKANMKTNFFES